MKIKYLHSDCGWIGTEDEMHADCAGEMWSNWICPKCGWWLQLEDYERFEITENNGARELCQANELPSLK